jgi:CubicO group peptidase (beta-lactamase class C family)
LPRFHLRMFLLAILTITTPLGAHSPKDRFTRITPQKAGYSPEKLDELRIFLEKAGSDSLLLLYDGKLFFEWGDIRKKLLVHSMRKPLLNSLYGHQVAQGAIDLQRTLADLDIDDLPNPLTAAEKRATLLDVLKSRSGVYHAAAAESDGMDQSKPARGSHAPGTHFHYNNWDFNVAGALYERATGRRIYDAFYREIAQPLGMLDYRNRVGTQATPDAPLEADLDGFYLYEPARSRFPAYHFRMSAHDLALFGQLYLNRGQWKGRQIVPSTWIAFSTQPYSVLEPEYGLNYGLLWNVLTPSSPGEQPSFYHTGVDIHMLGIYPKHKLVMVHRVDTEKPYRFNGNDLYEVIRRIHGARLPRP